MSVKIIIVTGALVGVYLCARILMRMNRTLDSVSDNSEGGSAEMDLPRKDLIAMIDRLRKENAALKAALRSEGRAGGKSDGCEY